MNVLLLLHVISAVAAFGGFFVAPMLARTAEGGSEALAKVVTTVQIPGLVLLALTGVGVVVASDDAFSMGDPWVSAAFAVVIAAIGAAVLVARAYRSGASSAPALTGVMHLLLVVGLVLMIWKPGQG